jgi:mono/diheme cytochrome c family protein
MLHKNSIHIALAMLLGMGALFSVRMHEASGAAPGADSIGAGHRLAEAWCKTCHAIGSDASGAPHPGPDFVKVANMPSTTELALKVFLRTSHPSMPNIVLTPEQTDNLVTYILSLKRN